VAEVREEYGTYFEALEQHPRMLVGTEVPRINGEGMEVLRDTNDAKEWQEAVKSLLIEDVKERTTKAIEDDSEFLSTMHQSIELFQNNVDLIPGTKDFDVELANKFATFMQAYELRDDDKKLIGYSVPVQPIINQLRSDLVASRAAATASPGEAAAPASTPAPAQPTPPADPPQAGIQSKAGAHAETEDFSTLFSTISPELRDLRI
jgi:hypothetical protein